MKWFPMLTAFILALNAKLNAQELFVFSEPASNMPAKSIGIRASNWFMTNREKSGINYILLPEIMWGANKNLMIHLDGFLSNQEGSFRLVGGGVYAKYRLYSADEVNRHFRLAAFGRFTINNSVVTQEEIDLTRYNSGYSLGFVATQLLHKQAVSASARFDQAFNNISGHDIPAGQPDQAITTTLSTGRLLLPKHYSNYKQTNLNLMVELIGQRLLNSGSCYLDLAPAIQFIFNSQTRVDLGYKMQLYSNMQRTNPNGIMIRFEHLLFNAF